MDKHGDESEGQLMAGEMIVTVVGNLTADPELRFTPSGAAVANFTVAHTPRKFDRDKNEWVDQEAIFLGCSVWRQEAENVAESLTRGTRVIVQGRMKARSFEDREGNKRTVHEIDVDAIGPELRFATAKVTKTTRQGGGQGGYGPPSDDPWASNQGGQRGGQQGGGQQGGGGNWGNQGGSDPWASAGGSSEDPPF